MQHVLKSMCSSVIKTASLTDEEDGEGAEEQENVRNHIQSVQKASVVQQTVINLIGGGVIRATERQGGVGDGCLRKTPHTHH